MPQWPRLRGSTALSLAALSQEAGFRLGEGDVGRRGGAAAENTAGREVKGLEHIAAPLQSRSLWPPQLWTAPAPAAFSPEGTPGSPLRSSHFCSSALTAACLDRGILQRELPGVHPPHSHAPLLPCRLLMFFLWHASQKVRGKPLTFLFTCFLALLAP